MDAESLKSFTVAKLDWRVVGFATGLFLALTYALCVTYDLAFDQRMYQSWAKLLPGFTWLTWPSFLLGLVESFLYGIYFGLVFVPLYNLCGSRLITNRPKNS